MKDSSSRAIFWIGYVVFFLVLGWSLASCNGSNAVPIETTSYTQLIELDLTNAHVNERYTVRGRQIFYDTGFDPAYAGYITVKINSTQSAPISLSPGGEINFYGGLEEIFVSNDAQPGKIVRLLVNEDATVNNPPNNPLTAGFDRTVDFLAFSNYHHYLDYLPGQQVGITIVDPANNPTGMMIHYIDASVNFVDYRDSITFYILSVSPAVYLMTMRGQQRELLKNVYLRPGAGLRIISESSTSGIPQSTFIAACAISISAVIEIM